MRFLLWLIGGATWGLSGFTLVLGSAKRGDAHLFLAGAVCCMVALYCFMRLDEGEFR